jgi:hypothetical protein
MTHFPSKLVLVIFVTLSALPSWALSMLHISEVTSIFLRDRILMNSWESGILVRSFSTSFAVHIPEHIEGWGFIVTTTGTLGRIIESPSQIPSISSIEIETYHPSWDPWKRTGWQSCPAATISFSLIQTNETKGRRGVRTLMIARGGSSGPAG